MEYKNILTFNNFFFKKLQESEDNTLKNIRNFKGNINQFNDYLAKKIKANGNEPNPYKNMQYKYPTERQEKEGDFISYQDFINGTSSHSNYLNQNRKIINNEND
jgi:hypothetical protein